MVSTGVFESRVNDTICFRFDGSWTCAEPGPWQLSQPDFWSAFLAMRAWIVVDQCSASRLWQARQVASPTKLGRAPESVAGLV